MRQSLSAHTFREGVLDGIPIALGYLSVSFGFGILAAKGALSPLTAALISLTNVTSAGQLAGLAILLSGGPLIEMILSELVINARYALMSISLTQKLDSSFGTVPRLVCAFAMTDEIFAVSSSKEGTIGKRYFYGLMLLPVAGWVLGTYLGAVAGNILPARVQAAMGIALYAMFLAIILPPSTRSRAVAVCVLIASALSVVIRAVPFLRFISSGFSVIICALAAALFAAWRFPVRIEDKNGEADAK